MGKTAFIGRLKTSALLIVVAVDLLSGVTAHASGPAFPLTTKSPEARGLADEAVNLFFERLETPAAVAKLHKAVAADGQFAMAHQLLSIVTMDTAEQIAEQQKAFATRQFAGPAEQAVIQWHQDSADRKSIDAITGMNEVLRQYPQDKLVVYLCVWWLFSQSQLDRALAVLDQSGILDSPGMLNAKAYTQAHLRQYDKAVETIAKYAASLPNEPNSQDSYGEMLRFAGRFDESIQHYQAALKIDPSFYPSQFGIADSFSLKGDQAQARREYAAGFEKFHPAEQDEVRFRVREATTYVRESDWQGADRAFQAIADREHARQSSQLEADIYRQIALYQPDAKQGLRFLDKANAVLANAKTAIRRDIQHEDANILRARVQLEARLHDKVSAMANLDRLRQMAQTSNDSVIERFYHGASGVLLYAEGDYNQAIAHLEQDTGNLFSLQLLVYAYEKSGDLTSARRAYATLAACNETSVEHALVVLPFRKCHQAGSCEAGSQRLF
ncbi:MAG TPA: hypothetical protein VKZ53_28810 [Candidatus Angelobacter sp.]|nr:hypothetical protein [Candidatus Angelobacter sp.]